MRTRATQIQPLDRRAVAAPARYRTHEENLVESELSVVEALLGWLQCELVGPHLQVLRHPIREGVMRAGRDELHMNLHPPIRALHLDVWGARVLAVFGVVIGPLQIVERGGDAECRVLWGLLERERATGDHT